MVQLEQDSTPSARSNKSQKLSLPNGLVQEVVDEGGEGDVGREVKGRLLLVHLDVVQKRQQVDHAVAKQRQELELWSRALRVDGEVVDEGLDAAHGSQVL